LNLNQESIRLTVGLNSIESRRKFTDGAAPNAAVDDSLNRVAAGDRQLPADGWAGCPAC
jgi:hypothetical protein